MEFIIRISDLFKEVKNHVDVTQLSDKGMVIDRFKLNLPDLISCLTSSTDISWETPILPSNCVKYISHGTPVKCDVYIELPKNQWVVSYAEHHFKVGFPRMILKYQIYGNNIQDLFIVAVKDGEKISGDTPLYYFPYTNMHSNHRVCMGQTQFPPLKAIRDLESMHLLFFAAPFSHENGAKTLLNLGLSKLFEKFSKTDFDDEILIPVGKTFNELFKFETKN
jgi:hypothetical protein